MPFKLNIVNVVIPVYKATPDVLEVISLRSVARLLSQHHITILVPETLDIGWYTNFFLSFKIRVGIERFADRYFENIQGYNDLLLSSSFYDRFRGFEYILICQPDCYIFKNELALWCSKNYDYVAAPWLESKWRDDIQAGVVTTILSSKSTVGKLITRLSWKIRGVFNSEKFLVGNGGLSLRKVSTFRGICSQHQAGLKDWVYNEDLFFGIYVPLSKPYFRIPPWRTAALFAIDLNPELLMTHIQGELPFGCHGWLRNEPPYQGNLDFWMPVIKKMDISV